MREKKRKDTDYALSKSLYSECVSNTLFTPLSRLISAGGLFFLTVLAETRTWTLTTVRHQILGSIKTRVLNGHKSLRHSVRSHLDVTLEANPLQSLNAKWLLELLIGGTILSARKDGVCG